MGRHTETAHGNIPLNKHSDSRLAKGWVNGFIGMFIFSGSLPATRVAVLEFPPLFLTGMRAVLAALLALSVLVITRQQRPQQQDILPLIFVASGVVIGFPLLTALALQHIGTFSGLHRPTATGNGMFWCPAWQRAPESRFLGVLCIGESARGCFCRKP